MTTYDSWKSTNPADELPSVSRSSLGPEPQPQPLSDRLDAVAHRHLDLKADNGKEMHRPVMSVWPSVDEDMPAAVVTLHLAAEWGQPVRYADMTPTEARILARHLIETANLVDRETGVMP